MKRITTEDLDHILDHTRDLWAAYFERGSTLFLTGGTGFFGKWLLESFLHINAALDLKGKVIALSRNPEQATSVFPQFLHPAITWLKGDVRSFDFPEEKIDYIIHAATDATVSLNMNQPFLMYDTIVEGTRRVLELGRQQSVKAILHTSSGAVYGKQPAGLSHIPEDYAGCPDIYEPGAAYGEGKRVAEMWSQLYYQHHGVPSKTARCFAFTGPYMPLDGRFAIGNFVSNMVAGTPVTVYGDGTPARSYMYTSDLCIWLYTILFKAPAGRPYNVGSEEAITIKDLARLIAASGGREEVVYTRPAGPPAPDYVPDTHRAAAELDLRRTVSLQEAIEKTINYYRHESQ